MLAQGTSHWRDFMRCVGGIFMLGRSALGWVLGFGGGLGLGLPAYGQATFFPANGTSGVCPDTTLRLSFSGPPVLGAGKIEIFDAGTNAAVDSIDVAVPTRVR